MLEKRVMEHMLLRSPDAGEYPHSQDVPSFKRAPPWFLRPYDGMGYEGLRFVVRRHFAYLSDDGLEWDAAMRVNDSIGHQDPWHQRDERPWELRDQVSKAWDDFPQANRAWLEALGVLPFESILDSDEIGDEYVSAPHIYAPFDGKRGPFDRFYVRMQSIEQWNPQTLYVTDMAKGRVVGFPEDLRKRESDDD